MYQLTNNGEVLLARYKALMAAAEALDLLKLDWEHLYNNSESLVDGSFLESMGEWPVSEKDILGEAGDPSVDSEGSYVGELIQKELIEKIS